MDVDERITQEIDRLARERDAQHLFDGVTRIRRRRAGIRRLGTAALAAVVLAGSAGGFLALSRAFGGGEQAGLAVGAPGNGLIAYSDLNTATGDGDIFVMASDGSGVMALPQPGTDYDPQWSPDGTQIYFAKDGEGIFVMDADGSHERKISDVSSTTIAISPDGSTIAYEGSVPASGPIRAGADMISVFDGQYVTPAIWLMGSDGSDPRALPGTEGSGGLGAAWSPDGSLLAFGKGNAVWVVGADGSDPHMVVERGSIPIWSSDGSRILYVSDRHSVEAVSLDGSGQQVLVHDSSTMYRDLAYAPDGTRILVTAAPDVNGPQNYEIYAMDPDGTNVEQVTNVGSDDQGWCCLSPSWQAAAP